MVRPRLELADILRTHGEAYRQNHSVSSQQAQVMTRLVQYRTAALGGHVDVCSNCNFTCVAKALSPRCGLNRPIT